MKIVVFSVGKKQRRPGTKKKSVNPGARFERVLFFYLCFSLYLSSWFRLL